MGMWLICGGWFRFGVLLLLEFVLCFFLFLCIVLFDLLWGCLYWLLLVWLVCRMLYCRWW